MRNYIYNNTIRNITIQFLDQFNNISVKRYDKSGSVIKIIGKVPLRFGPKGKIWNWIEQNNFDVVLPAISVFMTGVEFDSARMGGIYTEDRANVNANTGRFMSIPRPTPWNINYRVSIWTKYIEDLNQILENILPFFRPNTFIALSVPGSTDIVTHRVVLGSAAPTGNEEYSTEETRVITWDLEFTVHALLWKHDPDDTDTLIKKVFVNWWGYDATVIHDFGVSGDSGGVLDGTTLVSIDSTYLLLVSPKIDRSGDILETTVTVGNDITGGVLDWDYYYVDKNDNITGPFRGD